MFLRELNIIKGDEQVRHIPFRNGINLIVDLTGKDETGNDVGKTTTLKLIDFCLGANKKIIYAGTENKKDRNLLVKEFLEENEILIQLILFTVDENGEEREVVIERNFLSRGIRTVNGVQYNDGNPFDSALTSALFPGLELKKPSFRQLISHNIRYEDESLVNTLKTVNRFTSDVEYESLHLFMLGCSLDSGDKKQEYTVKLNQEIGFKKRLEKYQSRNAYEVSLNAVDREIDSLKEHKRSLNINENLKEELEELGVLKIRISSVSNRISSLKVRESLILEAKVNLEKDFQQVDTDQLVAVYEEAESFIPELSKTFENLLDYHNRMVGNKIAFITKRLPEVRSSIESAYQELEELQALEIELNGRISSSDSIEQLEGIIDQLNIQFKKKGEYEKIISQIKQVEDDIEELEEKLRVIDEQLFSDSFEELVKVQVAKFNVHYNKVSKYLYDESYGLNYKIETNHRTGKKVYKFSTFDVSNPNISSGKKQGEISCFEIAYVLFAREEGLPHLPFILNDKKELMHGNQLIKIAEVAGNEGIQFVCSMLEDKLPRELKNEDYYILKLSQDEKLFKIENSK